MRYGNGIPVNSEVVFGEIMPTFGRTQYFLGDVVFTCECHANIIYLSCIPSYKTKFQY